MKLPWSCPHCGKMLARWDCREPACVEKERSRFGRTYTLDEIEAERERKSKGRADD